MFKAILIIAFVLFPVYYFFVRKRKDKSEQYTVVTPANDSHVGDPSRPDRNQKNPA